MRKVATLAVAVTGLGLFATGVHGLTQIDGRLASETKQSQVRNVDVRHDCHPKQRPSLQRL